MRIVLDSNVLISAFLWGGKPKVVLDGVFKGKNQLFISKEILDEISEVLLRDKFKIEKQIISLFLHEIEETSELVFPSGKICDIVRDSDDHAILECALEADAEVIITGDKDLLVLKTFKNIKILHVSGFLDLEREFT